jgi:pyruvate kinase
MVASAVTLANSLHDSKLVVFTLRGRMARYASNLRPQRAPIFAFTPSEEVYRQLALYWGTVPVRVDFAGGPDKAIAEAEKCLRKNQWAKSGDRIVIVSDVRMGRALIDSIQLRVVK